MTSILRCPPLVLSMQNSCEAGLPGGTVGSGTIRLNQPLEAAEDGKSLSVDGCD